MSISLKDRSFVEAFHVSLLELLGLPPGNYAIKGGLNLRLFHGSPRFSEDLDIDVDRKAPASGTLRRKVDQVLGSKPLARRLAQSGLTIEAVSKPKQTETVQRWKVALRAGRRQLHTKIEFSRRGLSEGATVGFIDREIARALPVGASKPLAHYAARAAYAQKLRALIGRDEPQPRDVFDLHLLNQKGPHDVPLSDADRPLAIERALNTTFEQFRSKVLKFLASDVAEAFDDQQAWDALVLGVVRAIEEAPPCD